MKELKKEISPEIYQEIVEAVQHLKYGEVVITVYDSKVVQIEKKEKNPKFILGEIFFLLIGLYLSYYGFMVY